MASWLVEKHPVLHFGRKLERFCSNGEAASRLYKPGILCRRHSNSGG
jgi:hypothetical protein